MRSVVFLAILALTLMVHAIPAQTLTEAELASSAQATAVISRVYAITVNSELVPGLDSNVGKTYQVTIGTSVPSIFIDAKGDALVPASTVSSSDLDLIAIEAAKPTIVDDLAKADHVNQYGSLPTLDEITSYQQYFDEFYGLNYSKDIGTALSVNLVSVNVSIVSNGVTYPTKIISEYDSYLVSVIGFNLSANLIFGNETPAVGDVIYLLPPGNQSPSQIPQVLEPTVVLSESNDSITLARNVSIGTIAIDDSGNLVGLATQDGSILNSSLVLSQEAYANTSPSESAYTKQFLLAKDEYYSDNDSAALADFQTILASNPNDPESQYYLNQLLSTNSSQALLYKLQTFNPGLLLGLFLGSSFVLVFGYKKFISKPKRTDRGRTGKHYSASEQY